MNITVVNIESDLTFNLTVQKDLLLAEFKALCSADLQTPPEHITVIHNGRPLVNGQQTLDACGIKDNDMILVERIAPPQARTGGAAANPQANNPFGSIDFSRIVVSCNDVFY